MIGDEHPDRAFERHAAQDDERRAREEYRDLVARHTPAAETHAPRVLRKLGSAYRTDEGQEIPEHALYRYECSCGWKGAAWYAEQARAAGSFGRHLPAGASR